MTAEVVAVGECSRCHSMLRAVTYEVRTQEGTRALRCLRCSLIYRPMLWRSLLIALVVGTVLVAINQGNIILGGDFPAVLYWKIPLTYCVPFSVATAGAILNARSKFNGQT